MAKRTIKTEHGTITQILSPGLAKIERDENRKQYARKMFPIGTRVNTSAGNKKTIGAVIDYTRTGNLVVKWDNGSTISGVCPFGTAYASE